MAKMDYSNFSENAHEVIPAEAVEVLPPPASYDLSGGSSGGGGQALANAMSPVAAVTDCIKALADTVGVIGKCLAAVSIEKQRTEQVRAVMKAKSVESRQLTERVKIHEKEETRRLIATCEADLQAKKLELEKLRDEYGLQREGMEISHKEFIMTLDVLKKQTDDLMTDKDILRDVLRTALENGSAVQTEIYLHSLDEVNAKLIEVARQIVALKGMR